MTFLIIVLVVCSVTVIPTAMRCDSGSHKEGAMFFLGAELMGVILSAISIAVVKGAGA